MTNTDGAGTELTTAELGDLVLKLGMYVSTMGQVMTARTAKSAALVDDDLMSAFLNAADDFKRTLQGLGDRIHMTPAER